MEKTGKTYSIRCLRAIEGFVGGRERLAKRLGVSVATIAQWVRENKIVGKYILKLCEISDDHFQADELLGRFDDRGTTTERPRRA